MSPRTVLLLVSKNMTEWKLAILGTSLMQNLFDTKRLIPIHFKIPISLFSNLTLFAFIFPNLTVEIMPELIGLRDGGWITYSVSYFEITLETYTLRKKIMT